jgi:hypothetical protein
VTVLLFPNETGDADRYLRPRPNLAPRRDDDDDDFDEEDECRDCPLGSDPYYGPLDDLGRATVASATLRGPSWTGEKPRECPAGFKGGISGMAGEQHRAHLLARELGGSGKRNNLVPFGGRENIMMWCNVESVVAKYVINHPDHCVYYKAVPKYLGKILSPESISVYAYDECLRKFVVETEVENRPVH